MYTYVACTCPCTPTVPWERNSILLWQLERKIWKINPTKPECKVSVSIFCDKRQQRCTYVYMLSKIRKVQSTLPKSPRTRTLALPWSWTLVMFSSGFILVRVYPPPPLPQKQILVWLFSVPCRVDCLRCMEKRQRPIRSSIFFEQSANSHHNVPCCRYFRRHR